MTKSFKKLKYWFITMPILIYFDPHCKYIVEIDASDFVLGSTLSQTAKDKKIHLNTFHSRKFSPAKINYEIHDKELLTIVDCFKAWRRYLEGSLHMVQVFMDNKNLEYFMTTKVLNRKQVCLLTGGSLVTDSRVTQNFQKEKLRSNNPNKGN
jgi:hypothetical protein